MAPVFDLATRRQFLQQYGDEANSYFSMQAGVHFFDLPGIGYLSYDTCTLLGRCIHIVFCNPICAAHHVRLILTAFLASSQASCVFIGIDRRCSEILHELGYHANEFGIEYSIKITDFAVAGRAMKYLRSVTHYGERFGLEVIEDPPQRYIDETKRISTVWRASKKVAKRELRLLSRPFVAAPEWGVRKFYCLKNGQVIGFVFFDPYFSAGECIGYLASTLRQLPDVKPGGISDYVILTALKKFQDEGVRFLSLGIAPLHGISATSHDLHLVRYLMSFIYRYANKFYSFQELAFHKERYRFAGKKQYVCVKPGQIPTKLLAVMKTTGIF